jgi:hypothetical protein
VQHREFGTLACVTHGLHQTLEETRALRRVSSHIASSSISPDGSIHAALYVMTISLAKLPLQ